jgi:hypothetical protein
MMSEAVKTNNNMRGKDYLSRGSYMGLKNLYPGKTA